MNNENVHVGGKVYKKCQVVMLEGSGKAKRGDIIRKPISNNSLRVSEIDLHYAEIPPQHLYFLSNDKLQDEDWIYSPDFGVQKYQKHPLGNNALSYLFTQKYRKIVATTNPELYENVNERSDYHQLKSLPRPSNAFLEAYVKEFNRGNKIEEVLVEVDRHIEGGKVFLEEIRVAPDNTITIKPIKEYPEEMLLNMQYYMEYCQSNGYVTPKEWLEKYKHF